MKKPDHAAVVAAAKATGDRELIDLVSDPDEYVVKAKPLDGYDHHAVFRLLLNLDHPASFLVGSACDGKGLEVLSGQLEPVHRLLLSEPRVFGSDAELLARFFELYRNRFQRSEVLQAPTPRVERRASIATLSLTVRTGGRTERWTVVLPPSGPPTLRKEPFVAPREVVR